MSCFGCHGLPVLPIDRPAAIRIDEGRPAPRAIACHMPGAVSSGRRTETRDERAGNCAERVPGVGHAEMLAHRRRPGPNSAVSSGN